MIVPSNRLKMAFVALLATLAGLAQAAEFDEKLRAPLVKSAPALKASAESYSQQFARLSAASPTTLVTNKELFLEHFDLEWQFTRAVDDRLPLEDVSAIGLVKRDDGSIEIDLNAFPQWGSFSDVLAAMMPNMNFEIAGPLLLNRGFRETDVQAVENYLATHDLNAAIAAKTLPISIGFSRFVKKSDNLKRPLTKDLVYSFIYQRKKAEAEAQRAWAEGLLLTLDAQRVRVLHSYFEEMRGKVFWAPSDTKAGVAGLLALVRLPDYEERVAAEARGVTP